MSKIDAQINSILKKLEDLDKQLENLQESVGKIVERMTEDDWARLEREFKELEDMFGGDQ